MPANEFEKQVQQKMDEFQLEPSAAVWQKVEEEIRKKKRRRIVFFFVLPAAIALMALSVFYFTNKTPKDKIVHEQNDSNERKSETADKNKRQEQSKENSNIQPPTISKETGFSKADTKTKTGTLVNPGESHAQIRSVNPGINRRKNVKTGNDVIKNFSTKIKQDNSLQVTNEIPEKQAIVKVIPEEEYKSDKKIAVPVTVPEMNNDIKDVVAEQKDIVEPNTDSIAANDLTINKDSKEAITKKKTGKPQIKWGIDFSAGVSGSNENVFSLDFQKSLSDALYANPGSSAGGAQRVILPASSVNPGFSFKTGVTAELQVSNKSRISTGLQYAYSSNHVSTGRRQDSTVYLNNNFNTAQVNTFYGGVHRNKYNNKYHFIQVPLSYHWQFNKGKKLPLQWNAGLSFGYLMATNGLVYDTGYGGIYYRNKEVFNRFHVNIGTGVSLRLKGKSGSEWILGPEVWFDLKKLTNNPLDNRQYLMFGGINARFLFPQKKK